MSEQIAKGILDLFFFLSLLNHYLFLQKRARQRAIFLPKELPNEQRSSRESHRFKKELGKKINIYLFEEKIPQKTLLV